MRRGGLAGLVSAVFAITIAISVAFASEPSSSSSNTTSRISAVDPLNGGFLLINMHGMLFHPQLSDIYEDLSYARWLGGGLIRVFGTDSNAGHTWDGAHVGGRIVEIAPLLRAAHIRLIVAFVNNHQAVPGESADSAGWMDNYMQLLLPFYTTNWHGAYGQFVHDLVTTVQAGQAQDVIYAWELGNELHTPVQPDALIPFITQAAAQVRALDPVTPLLPGTMGANHVEPGNHSSTIARWLYCDAPVDAYTLHAYDWVSRDRPGDMPIDWDLDNIVSQPCPNGRSLPVIVEELGTSRALAGVYTADNEQSRLDQERRQIDFVRHFPQVVGFGAWNGESPRLVDRTFVDTRRGLTSYGIGALGGGSCYDWIPDPTPGARCQLEQLLRGSFFVRVNEPDGWSPAADADVSSPIVGFIDPVSNVDNTTTSLTLRGWVLDPLASDSTGVDRLDVFAGTVVTPGVSVARAQLGLARSDVPTVFENPNGASAGFSISLGRDQLPVGLTTFTLAAHTPDRGTWLTTLQVVMPSLGLIPPAPPTPTPVAAPVVPTPDIRPEVQSPQPGDSVPRKFTLQVRGPNAERVDVFLEPDRDQGAHLAGSAVAARVGAPLSAVVNAPPGSHTLYIHVSSHSGQEVLLTVPVVVRS